MVPILSLWLPIVLGAVLVFVSSSVIHMFLNYHKHDFDPVPDEDAVMDALRPFNIPPGDYALPYGGGAEALRSDAFREKVEEGPVLFFTALDPRGVFDMRASLAQWFLYSLLVGVFAAYIGGRTLTAGADYLVVFRITGAVAFTCYSIAHMQRSIWFKQRWGTTLRNMFDGLVYALLTAGAFGWLWPA
jgi:hypothetical protein